MEAEEEDGRGGASRALRIIVLLENARRMTVEACRSILVDILNAGVVTTKV